MEELQKLVQSILEHFREKVLSRYFNYFVHFYEIKEHSKSLNVKREEQKKWEDEVLKSHGLSMTSSMSVTFD